MIKNPPKVFKAFKERHRHYIDSGLPGCDSAMIDLIKQLDQLPDIACIFCCQGHPERKLKITVNVPGNDEPFVYNEDDDGYILFAFKGQAGINTLLNLYSKTIANITKFGTTNVTLEYCHMANFLEWGGNEITPATSYYYAMSIRWTFDEYLQGMHYIGALQKAVKEMIRG